MICKNMFRKTHNLYLHVISRYLCFYCNIENCTAARKPFRNLSVLLRFYGDNTPSFATCCDVLGCVATSVVLGSFYGSRVFSYGVNIVELFRFAKRNYVDISVLLY